MPNYCQYCANVFEGDCYYCNFRDEVMTEAQLRRATKCHEYVESDLGSVITGKQYKPRLKRPKPDFETASLFDKED